MIRYATCHIGDDEILVGYVMAPAEPDVGIRYAYIGDLWIEGDGGILDRDRTKALTEDETEKLRQQIYDQIG